MHDSSLAPLSPAPRQIYKCHANSWCCKEKLLPSFLTDNIRNFFHSAVLQKRKNKPYDSFSVGKCWILNKNFAMLFISFIETDTSWITSWVSFNNSERSSLWPLLPVAGAESHNKHNTCLSSKNIEQKLFLHGTKVILILFMELNETKTNIHGRCHTVQASVVTQEDRLRCESL